MTQSGEAAEQIVRMSLEGVEVAAKITGTAAKEIALFIASALKGDGKNLKPKGRARMASMLKSGKALEIFSVKDSDLKNFMQGAKQYGIVYCVLRNKKNDKDGMCDILVKADDAPKISRVIERFKFATVDKAKIESEIMAAKNERGRSAGMQVDAKRPAPDRNDTEKLLDELMGRPEGKAVSEKVPENTKPDVAKTMPEKDAPQNPTSAKTTKSRPSEPISKSKSKSAGATSSKPSVREELREIKAARTAKRDADAPRLKEKEAAPPRGNSRTTHKQPMGSVKPRSAKPKTKGR